MPNSSTSQASRPANSDHSVSTSHSSQMVSPNTPRSSASSASRPSHPVTFESLLAAHANAPDPIRSALEHVIADRNSFAVQNAQLWKLVEKQRTTTSQLNKDNDRIRAEREAYKSRLTALGDSPEVILKSFKEKERHHKPSSGSRSNSSPNPRAPLVRHQSDESKSSDASKPNLAVMTSQPLSNSSSDPSSQRPSRNAANPTPGTSTVKSSSSAAQHARIQQQSIQDQLELSSSPEQMVRHDEAEAEFSSPAVSPITAPPAPFIADAAAVAMPGSTYGQTPIAQTVLEPTTARLPPPSHNHNLSRESRVSLPPEVKQFISTMGESPLPSPSLPTVTESSLSLDNIGTNSIAQSSRMNSPARSFATTYSAASNPNSTSNLNVNHPYDPNTRHDSPRRGPDHSDGEFLDMEDGEDDERDLEDDDSTGPRGRRTMDSEHDMTPAYGGLARSLTHEASPGPKLRAEDFPMPPLTTPHDTSGSRSPPAAQTAFQHDASYPSQTPPHRQTVTVAADVLADGPQTPTANTYNTQAPSAQMSGTTLGSTAMNGGSPFRALPLLPHDLPRTRIQVTSSSVRPNERGKDVLSFVVYVDPNGGAATAGAGKGKGKECWSVEKMYSDVLGLDQRVRARVGKSVGKKIANLPDGKLWRDHAPSKVDQRKAVLEQYLQALIDLPIKNNDEVIAFLTSDILKEANKPVHREGYKEGYLTKRGKNFGGWKTRFFVLQGPQLEYYESRGGTHLGSIAIAGAQIGRQQRPTDRPQTDEENDYRHAFLIIESRKTSTGTHRHVLCAESDEERDNWVEILVRYVSGVYDEEPIPNNASGASINVTIPTNSSATIASRASAGSPDSTASSAITRNGRPQPPRGMSKDDISVGPAVPLSQLPHDINTAKLFQNAAHYDDISHTGSPVKGNDVSQSPHERLTDQQTARRLLDKGASPSQSQSSLQYGSTTDLLLSSSLPTTSPLESGTNEFLASVSPRANSELGHYPDMVDPRTAVGGAGNAAGTSRSKQSDSRNRHLHRQSYHPTLEAVKSSPSSQIYPSQGASQSQSYTHLAPTAERSSSPDLSASAQTTPKPDMTNGANAKVKISGPMNGAPIPAGLKFGTKEKEAEAHPPSERREKVKSRMFWDRFKGDKPPAIQHVPRNVFGVSLEESLDVSQMAGLPSIVFRCINFLETKHAEQEEGIYRLSGSSAVIKALKDRFNNEGDVDLLGTDEYWDPHAIAGLLKSFFRELPISVLTRELHTRFLEVINLADQKERVRVLSGLVQMLPVSNYSLLRALAAHLILIVQNANINKMTMRNVGIVFSPTLGIPAGVFSLMLADFDSVFNVGDDDPGEFVLDEKGNAQYRTVEEVKVEDVRRNSRQYADAAADQLLGLSGRKLAASEEGQSDDGEELSLHDESGTETTDNDQPDSSNGSSPGPQHSPSPDTMTRSRMSNVAATRGLNITVTGSDTRRYSRLPGPGLPASPRPTGSPLNPRSAGLAPSGGTSSQQPSPSSASLLTPR